MAGRAGSGRVHPYPRALIAFWGFCAIFSAEYPVHILKGTHVHAHISCFQRRSCAELKLLNILVTAACNIRADVFDSSSSARADSLVCTLYRELNDPYISPEKRQDLTELITQTIASWASPTSLSIIVKSSDQLAPMPTSAVLAS